MKTQKDQLIEKYTALCGEECISKIQVQLEQVEICENKISEFVKRNPLLTSARDYINFFNKLISVESEMEKQIQQILGVSEIRDATIKQKK